MRAAYLGGMRRVVLALCASLLVAAAPTARGATALMPWRGFAGRTDAEIHTLWSFLAGRRSHP
jgi:hypothetical protein